MPLAIGYVGCAEDATANVNWHTSIPVTSSTFPNSVVDEQIYYTGGTSVGLYGSFTLAGLDEVMGFSGTEDTDAFKCYTYSSSISSAEHGVTVIFGGGEVSSPLSALPMDKLPLVFSFSSGSSTNSVNIYYARRTPTSTPVYPSDITIHFGTVITDPTAPGPDENFSDRRVITVKKEAVCGNPTDVHVMVEVPQSMLDDNLIWAAINYQSGAASMRLMGPLSDTATQVSEIAHDIAAVYDGITLRVRVFFCAPYLDPDKDTKFYLYYGGRNQATSSYDMKDVWTQTRSGVWHFNHEVVGELAG